MSIYKIYISKSKTLKDFNNSAYRGRYGRERKPCPKNSQNMRLGMFLKTNLTLYHLSPFDTEPPSHNNNMMTKPSQTSTASASIVCCSQSIFSKNKAHTGHLHFTWGTWRCNLQWLVPWVTSPGQENKNSPDPQTVAPFLPYAVYFQGQ